MKKNFRMKQRIIAGVLPVSMIFSSFNQVEVMAKATTRNPNTTDTTKPSDKKPTDNTDTTKAPIDTSGGKPIHNTGGDPTDNTAALDDAGIHIRDKDETIEDEKQEKKEANQARIQALRAITSISMTSTELVEGETPLYGNLDDKADLKIRGNGQPIEKATVAALNDRRDPGVPHTEDAKSSEGSTRLLFRVYDPSGNELDLSEYTLTVTDRNTGLDVPLRDANILGDRDNPTITPQEVKAFSEIDDPVRIYFPGNVPTFTDDEFAESNPDHEQNLDLWWKSYYKYWFDDYEVRNNLLDFNRVGNYTVTATLNVNPAVKTSMDVDAVNVPKGLLITKGDTIVANGYGGGSTSSPWKVPSAGGAVDETVFKIASVKNLGGSENLLDDDLVQLKVVEYDYAKATPDNPNFDPEIQSTIYYYVQQYDEDGNPTTMLQYWGDVVDESIYTLSEDKTEIVFHKPGLYQVSASIGEPERANPDQPYGLFPDWNRFIGPGESLPISVSSKPTRTLVLNGGNTVDASGNEIELSQTVDYATRFYTAAFPQPIQSGFTFDNWYTDQEFVHSLDEKEWHFYEGTINHVEIGKPVVERKVKDWQYKPYFYLLSDTTFYANWLMNSYNVNFIDSEFGLTTPAQIATFESYLEVPDIAKQGYRIEGWYKEPSFVNKYDFSNLYNIDSPVTEVLGQQKINPVTGKPMILPDVDSDKIIIRDDEGNPVGTPIYEKNYVGDTNLYAKWEAVSKYTITFDVDGGSTVPAQSVSSDWTGFATSPDNPTKAEYIFDNWYTDKTYTTLYDFSQPIKNDTVIYAKFNSLTKCQISFNSNGGNSVSSQIVYQYDKVEEPTAPTKPGNTFIGWFTDEELLKPYDFNSKVTESITLYAKWKPVPSYAVTFITDNGTNIPTASVTQGDVVIKPNDPTKEGYKFGGWYTDREYTDVYDFTRRVESDIVLYAKWLDNSDNGDDSTDDGADEDSTDYIEDNNYLAEKISDNTYRHSILTVGIGDNNLQPNTKIDVYITEKSKKYSDKVKAYKDDLVKYNHLNKILFETTLFDTDIYVNKSSVEQSKNPISLKYDLNEFDFSGINTGNLIGIMIDDITGEVKYLGGRYNEKTGIFETETKTIHGDSAVVFADTKNYNQATFVLNNVHYNSNGEISTIEAAPFVENGVTYIPLRALSETFGAKVRYEASTKKATITLDGESVCFTNAVSEDGNPAPKIVKGRMFIPVRYASETLGANVIWYADDKNIQITK